VNQLNNKEHVLFCIMGESSSGKDTLIRRLCDMCNFTQLISYTTRQQRINEGNTHIFVDEEFYCKARQNNEIAAYTYINNSHYWSTIDQLYNSDLYTIDPEGVNSLRALNLPNLRIVTVYINVPEDIRKQRAMERGDNPSVYRARCMSERNQFKNMKKNMDVDYVIPNINKANAISVLKWITTVEGLWMNHAEDQSE
jgi:guanylate kinase